MVKTINILDNNGTIFDTDSHYVIPRYQRAYAWEDKEIIQLIDDINDIECKETVYYIGSLVVAQVKGKENTYEVVDGQQRLTTLYLLLQYLVYREALNGELSKTLSFDCRENSNYTLSHIEQVINKTIEEEERLEQSIVNGIEAIRQKFSSDNIDVDDFTSRLQQVVIYRIEVPKNTDLNRYFEIMNTRGEQLEQHDILKAQLMSYIDNRSESEQEFFARVWDACSDMTGYVQMHFHPSERQNIFGWSWNAYPEDKWENYRNCFSSIKETEKSLVLSKIIQQDFKVDDTDGVLEDNSHVRFDSIIDFPHFLLHSLRVFVKLYVDSKNELLGELLDDKKLIIDFDNVIKYGSIDDEPIKKNCEYFSTLFIVHLLQTRYLFDKFIIKREYIGEDQDGKWSLKELYTTGGKSNKKAYYANTSLNYDNEWERTYAPRNKECLMIQSALRVSYTSPKVMHWITDLLCWLFYDVDIPLLTEEAERVAAEAVHNNFLEGKNYALGVATPHVVFNFLDYLIWKKNKSTYQDFEFEFRNSVEHWYPQNPSDGSIERWDDKDRFGNLCIISRSVNSKFSNLSPESKMKSYRKHVEKGSLKLRIMGTLINGVPRGGNEAWINKLCDKHENEMLNLLREAIAKYI
ncbi:MAG: DUF262 domain-containing protein [Paludibacteraceae bacterium]|nr:DUF262 domain-containing protein [Paludibacteraceae bacterium]